MGGAVDLVGFLEFIPGKVDLVHIILCKRRWISTVFFDDIKEIVGQEVALKLLQDFSL